MRGHANYIRFYFASTAQYMHCATLVSAHRHLATSKQLHASESEQSGPGTGPAEASAMKPPPKKKYKQRVVEIGAYIDRQLYLGMAVRITKS